jgi:hypothetical protein
MLLLWLLPCRKAYTSILDVSTMVADSIQLIGAGAVAMDIPGLHPHWLLMLLHPHWLLMLLVPKS